MTTIIQHGYTIAAAKKIIDAFYKKDPSSTYIGNRHHRLDGSAVNVNLERIGDGWTVNIRSSIWSESTCREIIEKALNTDDPCIH